MLPHPHVLGRARIERPRPRHHRFVVAVHAKSMRANMDPLPVIDALVPVVRSYPAQYCRSTCTTRSSIRDNHWYAPELGKQLLRLRALRTSRGARSPVLHRRRTMGISVLGLGVGAALPIRHPFGLAGGVFRPRHRGHRTQLRLLRRATPLRSLRLHRGHLRLRTRCSAPSRTPTGGGGGIAAPRATLGANVAPNAPGSRGAHREIYEGALA